MNDEVRFVLDNESESPLDVQLYSLLESNALVERGSCRSSGAAVTDCRDSG
jgi:hypothetical protein